MRIFDDYLARLPRRAQISSALIGGFLVSIVLGGGAFSLGNLLPYIVSYMARRVPGYGHDGTVDYSSMVWAVSFADFGMVLTSMLGGLVEKRIGPRCAVFLYTLILGTGAACSYFTVRKSFWLWVLTFSFLPGLGAGFAYNTVSIVCMRWLPKNRGLANGIAMIGLSVGGSIFTAIETAYVNPTNYTPNIDGYFVQDELLDRVPRLFLVLASIWLVINVFGGILLVDRKLVRTPALSMMDTTPLLSVGQQKATEYNTHQKYDEWGHQVSPKEALKSSTFWILWLTWVFTMASVRFVQTYIKAFGQTFIQDDHSLSILIFASALLTAVSYPFWGALCDKLSYQTSMLTITALYTMFVSSVPLTPLFGKASFYAWTLIISFTMGAPFVLQPTVVATAFGEKNIGVISGLMLSNSGVAAITMSLITLYTLNPLGYSTLFPMMGGFGCCAFLLTLVVHKTKYGKRIGSGQ